mgnify:FL=1
MRDIFYCSLIKNAYLCNEFNVNKMFIENVGTYAGQIWCALEGKNALSQKEIKKATKLKDKEFYLGLGWLLREDKINVTEGEEENYYALK